MLKVIIFDDDGHLHNIKVKHGRYGYYANYASGSYKNTKSQETPEKAIQEAQNIINKNCAKRFDDLPIREQETIINFIQSTFQKRPGYSSVQYSSRHISHIIEKRVGYYVGNGAVKGAMKRAGFSRCSDQSDLVYCYWLTEIPCICGAHM